MVVANKKIFSKFDVVKAFYSIGVREKDWLLLCTGTSFGSFLYTVVPMGLVDYQSVGDDSLYQCIVYYAYSLVLL